MKTSMRQCYILLGTILVLTFTACSTRTTALPKQVRVETQSEVASSHVTILSVAPWEEYSERLKTNFTLTEAQALERVAKNNMAIDAAESRKLALSLRAGLQSKTLSTEQVDTLTDGVLTTQSTTTQKVTPGSTENLQEPELDGNSIPGLTDARDLSAILGAEVSLEPTLQYQAAAALIQEVELINSYLDSAAIPKDSKAFVVRLQVSVMPRANYMPYDTYTDITFLPAAVKKPEVEQERILETAKIGKQPPQTINEDIIFTENTAPRILPLFVTDSIASSVASNRSDNLLKIGLALSAMIQNASVDLGAAYESAAMEQIIRKEVDSVLTTSSLTHNTLRVKIGAQRIAGSVYDMTTRNHAVTALVIIPKATYEKYATDQGTHAERAIAVLSKTTYIDAEDGSQPAESIYEPSLAMAKALVANQAVSNNDSGKAMSELAKERKDVFVKIHNHVIRNDWFGFIEELNSYKNGITTDIMGSIWLRIAHEHGRTNRDNSYFTLEQAILDNLEETDTQRVTFYDDGTKGSLVIPFNKRIPNHKYYATLKLNENVVSASSAVTIDGNHMAITFPSPTKGLGAKIKDGMINGERGAIGIWHDGLEKPIAFKIDSFVATASAAKLQPQVKIHSPQGQLAGEKNNEITIWVTIEWPKGHTGNQDMVFESDKAVIEKAETLDPAQASSVEVKHGGLLIKGNHKKLGVKLTVAGAITDGELHLQAIYKGEKVGNKVTVKGPQKKD